MSWFTNKKVVITGGSSGIGKAAAILLAKQGASVCIVARNESKLTAALDEIRELTASRDQIVIAKSIDISDRAAVMAAAPDIIAKLGGIDVLVNCAGIGYPGYIQSITDATWDSMIHIDYMGTVNIIRAFLPCFTKQKSGNIANVSSVLGYMGVFGYAAYGAAKYAVVGLSECLRQDLLPYNINISVLYPPDTDTPQWHEENKIKPPETRMLSGNIKVLTAEKVASELLKGIEKKSFSIVPGTMNKVTWFLSKHLPWLVWMIVSGDLKKYWKKHPVI